MTIQLVVERGTDYRALLELLEAEGYNPRGKAGHTEFTMANGDRSVYTIFAEASKGDRSFHELVAEAAEGSIEFRPQ